MGEVKFTVITVCFNNLAGLKSTYESLKKQVYNTYEWIVIDGASKDGTADWLASLGDSNINWISEPDNGIFDAMNKGLDKSGGDFLVFMNSGDLFADSEVLQTISDEINRSTTEVAFIYGDSLDFEENGKTLYRKARDVSFYTKGMFAQHQSMYFNRDFLGALNYNIKYPVTADYAFIGSYILKIGSKKIIYINKPLCKFLLGGTNEQKRFKGLKEDYHIRTKVFKISAISAGLLFFLHLAHTIAKKIIPYAARKIRYD